jgi:hypothetical protein
MHASASKHASTIHVTKKTTLPTIITTTTSKGATIFQNQPKQTQPQPPKQQLPISTVKFASAFIIIYDNNKENATTTACD